MALKWNQFLSVRNPYTDVLEFTLTEYVRVDPTATIPVPYAAIQGSERFRARFLIEAHKLGQHAIPPCRAIAALEEIVDIIEMLQYKIRNLRTVGKEERTDTIRFNCGCTAEFLVTTSDETDIRRAAIISGHKHWCHLPLIYSHELKNYE